MNKAVFLLPPMAKSMTVYFFVLLPPLLALGQITAAELGYIGALSIGMLVVGALSVSGWLHRFSSKRLVQYSAWLALACAGLLLLGVVTKNTPLIAVAFAISGFEVGVSISAAHAIQASHTQRGARYSVLAWGRVGDLNRILFPIVVAVALSFGGLPTAAVIIMIMSIVFILLANRVPASAFRESKVTDEPTPSLRSNRSFRSFAVIEFLDSFASSQLFVFIPVLFLAKGYSLKSTLVLQTAIFVGYFAGRWLMGWVANRFTGTRSVAIAEIGMAATIGVLLFANNLFVLYGLTLLLGIFARGTSPVIKALAFDSLSDQEMKRGTAVHVVAGDSGSALGQLAFGLLLAWVGVTAPFLVATGLALLVAVLATRRPAARVAAGPA